MQCAFKTNQVYHKTEEIRDRKKAWADRNPPMQYFMSKRLFVGRKFIGMEKSYNMNQNGNHTGNNGYSSSGNTLL
jgi:hypothetical protein